MNPVNHVAIIMDGNGRWGLKRGKSRNYGHQQGLKTIEKIVDYSIKKKISYLTLFTFSSENWKRPKKEINFLFKLLENYFKKNLLKVIKNGIDQGQATEIRVLFIGTLVQWESIIYAFSHDGLEQGMIMPVVQIDDVHYLSHSTQDHSISP